MFPSVKNGQEQANGISIIIDAVESGIPVVVCSDTDHHQVQFLPKMCNHIRERNQGAEVNLVLDQKDWKKAVELLLPTD
jgi:methylmalonyl-CoA mutase cobalamin-binding subunit